MNDGWSGQNQEGHRYSDADYGEGDDYSQRILIPGHLPVAVTIDTVAQYNEILLLPATV